ncbi:MAG: hypothetical protein AAF639_26650 [Chloroflexota bacterium]
MSIKYGVSSMSNGTTAPNPQASSPQGTSPKTAALRQQLQDVFDSAYLKQDVFTKDDDIMIYWPEDRKANGHFAIRIQSTDGRIYSEFHNEGHMHTELRVGSAYQFADGNYELVIMPHPRVYYEGGLRIMRKIPCTIVSRSIYLTGASSLPSEMATRKVDALTYASQYSKGISAETAKMALQHWPRVKTAPIEQAIERLQQDTSSSDLANALDRVGLLGMVYRFWEEVEFPDELRDSLQACLRNATFIEGDALSNYSEIHQLLLHSCEILTGQLFADDVFTDSGLSGWHHREQGERNALVWLRDRGQNGFSEWQSPTYIDEIVFALVHLADFAESDAVHEMATVILDKLCFLLAVNTHNGVYGVTASNAYVGTTASITRLLWGQGVNNQYTLGSVSLACTNTYQLPALITQIVEDTSDEVSSSERHLGADGCIVHKLMYRTTDYMLTSVETEPPGGDKPLGETALPNATSRRFGQLTWQASLSPTAIVAVEQSDETSTPRTAQWKDLVVSIHNNEQDNIYAYFPTYAFDEWVIEGNRAFARVEGGYLALTANHDIALTKTGLSAYRELVTQGTQQGIQTVWLCQMGRSSMDGTFDEFKAGVLALEITFDGASAQVDTLRGETIAVNADGTLLVDGVEQTMSEDVHVDNPYCHMALGASEMDIVVGEQVMRLHVAT